MSFRFLPNLTLAVPAANVLSSPITPRAVSLAILADHRFNMALNVLQVATKAVSVCKQVQAPPLERVARGVGKLADDCMSELVHEIHPGHLA
jgi:hypothetical protein